VQQRTEDIAHRLEYIYNESPELENHDMDDLGKILDAVDDVIDDFHYSLTSYMEEMERGKEPEEGQEELDFSEMEPFMEENLKWETEPDEEFYTLDQDEEHHFPKFER
jgi:type IV secretory pathway VirB4 component